MDEQRTGYLLQQYQSVQINPDEWEELQALLADDVNNETIRALLQQAMEQHATVPGFEERDYRHLIEKVMAVDRPVPAVAPVRSLFFRRRLGWAAAAVLLIGIGIAAVFIVNSGNNKPSFANRNSQLPADVAAPRSNKATVTLADGSTVSLDSLHKGLLAQQGNVRLVKLADGQIVYQADGGKIMNGLQYNTLTNPRGSKVIDMVLGDGSHVWLNAGSSVTYPVAFVGRERKVAIAGEAYFEVAHDDSKPFYVTKGNVEVKVLGTHFNVNAYNDDANIHVTLLEGSVKVSTKPDGSRLPTIDSRLLKPGEQASISAQSNKSPQIVVLTPDIDQVMAWKNGLFNFDNADLKTVMQQLARWYDLEISYEGPAPQRSFRGKVTRDLNLSEVLKLLETVKVKYRIEGRKLVIMQ